ncbi:MAG TPA: 1-deoxy-D-xylulose-5-phosphate reductoisomerase [Nitrospiria bacterium]|jgi:1-deoxy-D-xylulose-5-phosphate reductoisomerase|nr:1-deoxy-D-xylulose-5-phosphate reductoisomerase [Nitrospiria bacterium]
MKNLVLLGSTGSVGTNALRLAADFPDRFRVVGLTAGSNNDKLLAQIRRFRPRCVALADPAAADRLRRRCERLPDRLDRDIEILSGTEGLARVATMEEADLVVSAIVGSAGLVPTFAAIRAKKTIALANKEPLVMAGPILQQEAQRQGIALLPVDSEHSAIFQSMSGQRRRDVRRLILTASGGPLLDLPIAKRRTIKPAQALKHPTWRMGSKISIDSATLMNKGLEVIEARWLFDMPPDRIDVVIHRQSIVHSMVEYLDGSVIAQMGVPDMRGPLAYALNYPERLPLGLPSLELTKVRSLTFEPPDLKKFPCLGYAYEAIKAGGSLPAVLNAANEVAVRAYLDGRIGFLGIARLIRKTMDAHVPQAVKSLEDVLEADRWGREKALKAV